MNTIIQRLAEEASHQSPDGYAVTIPFNKDFAQKFAELIIEHTVNVARAGVESGYSLEDGVYAYFDLDKKK